MNLESGNENDTHRFTLYNWCHKLVSTDLYGISLYAVALIISFTGPKRSLYTK